MKTAFMTMDVESLYDAQCLTSFDIKYDKQFSMEEKASLYIDLLDKYNIKGTFFTVSTSLNVAEEVLKKAAKNGHEIALHGLDHTSPFDISLEEFKKNISTAKKILEKKLETKVTGYRAPCFGITEDVVKIIRSEGFEYDSSYLNYSRQMKSGKMSLSSFKRITSAIYRDKDFYEFALPKSHLIFSKVPIGGGSYIRLMDWGLYKKLFKNYVKTHDTFVFYAHPFEISAAKLPDLKGLPLYLKMYFSFFRRFYLRRLEWVINYLKDHDFEFLTMSEYIKRNKKSALQK